MSDLPFLDAETAEPEVVTPPEPAPAEPVVEQQPEPVVAERDEKGRFAPKPEPKPEPVMVPLAALHETRDEVKALKAQLEQQRQQLQAQPDPDIFEDPDGFKASIQQQIANAVYAERMNASMRWAEQTHGKEVVQQAVEWGKQRCDADPMFNQAVLASPDPVGFAVQQMQRERIASEVDLSEYEKFKAWQAAQAQTQQQQPAVTPQTPPPASIASLPSSGGAGHVPVGPGQAFDSLFTR